jgi:threonine-phosphate decarboxylase
VLNGIAETFLVHAPEYQEEFLASCEQVRNDRDQFYEDLCMINDLLVYRPEANYIFCRLPDDVSSGPEVARRLFVDHNIYVKHCEGKTMPESDRYLRIASRTQAENKTVALALDAVIRSEKKL